MDRHRIEVEGRAISRDDTSPAGRLRRIERSAEPAAGSGARAKRWNPPFRGNLDMRISTDGTWHYQGSAITRQRMVELFASVLRREGDGGYYLVTPAEKFRIQVDDAPFLAVAMEVEGSGRGQQVTFHTNVGDSACAGIAHPLRFEHCGPDGGLKPYIHIRDGLEALASRALVYDLVEIAGEHEVAGERRLGVWSQGAFFDMAGADALIDR